MEFTAYSVTYTKVINVAGGGLSNGNAYANIEIEYTDSDMNEIKRVFYAEYGKNPCRRWIGVDIDWGEDDQFNVIDWDGEVVNSSGESIMDDTEDEEEEEEEEDKVLDYFKSLEQAGQAKMVSFEEFQKGHNGPKGEEDKLAHHRKNVSGTSVSR